MNEWCYMARRPTPPGVDRRQQILDAALHVFAEQGFEGATTKDIAARADVTHGLIYFYFPSKEDVLIAAFEYQAKRNFDQLDFTDEINSLDPPEVLIRRIVTRFVDVLGAPGSMSLLHVVMRTASYSNGAGAHELHAAAGEVPAAAAPASQPHSGRVNIVAGARIRALIQQVVAPLRACFAAQMARGAMRAGDPQVAVEAFLGGITSILMRRAKDAPGQLTLPREALIDELTALYAHGLTALPGPSAQRVLVPVATNATAATEQELERT